MDSSTSTPTLIDPSPNPTLPEFDADDFRSNQRIDNPYFPIIRGTVYTYGNQPQGGEDFEILRTNIKRWSVGSPIQAPLDSLALLIQGGLKADRVEKLVVRVAHQGANTTNNRNMPDICMQHMCAVMLLDGTVTFKSSHDERRMRHPRVLELRKRITLEGDDALTQAMPSRQGIVEVTLKDGTTDTSNIGFTVSEKHRFVAAGQPATGWPKR